MTFGVPTSSTTTTATSDTNTNGVLAGTQWTSTTVTYSFTNSTSDYESNYESYITDPTQKSLNGFQQLTAAQQTATQSWLTQYSNVSNLNFVNLTGASDLDATIRLSQSTTPSTAYAYYPGNYVEAGDVFVGTSYNYTNPQIGTYAFYTFGHELGHTLGLKHGNETGGVSNTAMNSNRDSMEFSIMTYRSYIGAPTTYVYNAEGSFAQTLMMYDISAIQQMYGADFTYNSSNTTYTFSKTTGEMFINGVGQGASTTNTIFRTVWDGDGIDTYDFSNYTTNLSVDLTPGGWSDLDTSSNFQAANLGNGNYAQGEVYNAIQYNGDARSLIENATGGSGNDVMVGNSANNVLIGNSGNDTIDGGIGNDTLDGGIGNDTLNGGTGDDTLIGGAGTNILNGGDGNDVFYTTAGSVNTMTGGAGNDLYAIYNTTDSIIEGVSEGSDSAWAFVNNYNLAANVESLYLIGSFNGNGNSGDNIIFGIDNGDNIIDGGAGNDYIDAGDGNDTIVGGDGNDTLFGGNGNDNISGGNGNDSINGGNGNDTINGGTGDDTINGGDGINVLNGGDGNDNIYTTVSSTNTLTGGAGNDVYTIYNSTDTVTEVAGEGTDSVWAFANYNLTTNAANVENLYLVGSINVTGNSSDNFIYSVDSGDNIIDAGAGNDYVNAGGGNDSLDGGLGADILIGGLGNDAYFVDNVGDVVSENAGEGTDTVNSSISYTLLLNCENLVLTGTAANGTGNTLANTITGNSAANTLNGGSGNDTLIGGLGNDIFQFSNSTDGIDTISDFVVGTDTIGISAAGFGGGLSAGVSITLAQILTVSSGSAATSSSQRFIYNSTTGGLFFDVDGNGGTAATQFATLSTGLTLGTNFFTVSA